MEPITRLDNFLAMIAGDSDAKDIDPISRREHFLKEIAEELADMKEKEKPELPTVDKAADVGKVLTVGENGVLAWTAPVSK